MPARTFVLLSFTSRIYATFGRLLRWAKSVGKCRKDLKDGAPPQQRLGRLRNAVRMDLLRSLQRQGRNNEKAFQKRANQTRQASQAQVVACAAWNRVALRIFDHTGVCCSRSATGGAQIEHPARRSGRHIAASAHVRHRSVRVVDQGNAHLAQMIGPIGGIRCPSRTGNLHGIRQESGLPGNSAAQESQRLINVSKFLITSPASCARCSCNSACRPIEKVAQQKDRQDTTALA